MHQRYACSCVHSCNKLMTAWLALENHENVLCVVGGILPASPDLVGPSACKAFARPHFDKDLFVLCLV